LHGLLLRLPEQHRLLELRLALLAREAGDLGPALDEPVVGESLGSALLALAEGVEPVGVSGK